MGAPSGGTRAATLGCTRTIAASDGATATAPEEVRDLPVPEIVARREVTGSEAVGDQVEDRKDQEVLPSVDHLQHEDREKFRALLQEYSDVFSSSEDDIGEYTGDQVMVIETGNAEPVRQRAYRTPLHLRDQLQEKLKTLEEQGLIEQSTSPWASPVVLVKKRDSQQLRFCCDYRAVNEKVKHDAFPLPRVEDLIQATGGARYFSLLDQRAAYWAIPLDEKSKEVTAFITEYGLHQWTRMPFGMKTSPGAFQRIMEDILHGLTWRQALVYLDDVILFTETLDQHLELLAELLERFRISGLKLNPTKCTVAVTSVRFLGHQLDEDGIKPSVEKVQAIRSWPVPGDVHELRQFLGFCGYYQQYVPHFSEKSAPMTDLLKKGVEFQWTEKCEEGFRQLKDDLEKYPVLQFPKVEEKFILTTDASGTGWGAELRQESGVVAFASGKWSTAEANRSVTERELTAVVKAVVKYRHYLIGQKFTLRTDHEAIRFLQRAKQPGGRLFRWLTLLQEYEFDVEHVPGKSIPHVDALSRCLVRAVQQEAPDVRTDEQVDQDGGQEDGRQEQDDEEDDVRSDDRLDQDGDREDAHQHQQLKDLVVESARDPVLCQLIHHLKGEEVATDHLTTEQQAELTFYQGLEGLHVRDGRIQRRSRGHQRAQQLVPASLRELVVQLAHAPPLSGHGGVKRTLHRLTARYFWYNMKKDVRRVCGSCSSCLEVKPKNVASTEGRGTVPVLGEPLAHWSADVLELPESENGYRYVLVVTDQFTKWIEAFPLKRQTAEDVAQCLVQVMCRFGLMKSLLTDQGRNFESSLVKRMCQLMGIKKLRTTIYHPCCNGLVERVNRSLIEMLAHYVGSGQRDWDRWLSLVTTAYNSGCHSTTGVSPWELVYGTPARSLVENELGEQQELGNQSYQQFLAQLKRDLSVTRERALERIKRDQEKRTESGQPGFQVGDLVYCRNFTAGKGKVAKLRPKFEGPYRIIEAHSPDYIIKKGRRKRVVHGSHLKKAGMLLANQEVMEEDSDNPDEGDSGRAEQRSDAEQSAGVMFLTPGAALSRQHGLVALPSTGGAVEPPSGAITVLSQPTGPRQQWYEVPGHAELEHGAETPARPPEAVELERPGTAMSEPSGAAELELPGAARSESSGAAELELPGTARSGLSGAAELEPPGAAMLESPGVAESGPLRVAQLASSGARLAVSGAELAPSGAELAPSGAELTPYGAELVPSGAELGPSGAELASSGPERVSSRAADSVRPRVADAVASQSAGEVPSRSVDDERREARLMSQDEVEAPPQRVTRGRPRRRGRLPSHFKDFMME